VLLDGATIAGLGIIAGALGGFGLERLAHAYVENVRMPGALPVLSATGILVVAALIASLLPAARASRVDVLQALRSE
jgi:ABC-type antimicrobial peptide transport system permease subunit